MIISDSDEISELEEMLEVRDSEESSGISDTTEIIKNESLIKIDKQINPKTVTPKRRSNRIAAQSKKKTEPPVPSTFAPVSSSKSVSGRGKSVNGKGKEKATDFSDSDEENQPTTSTTKGHDNKVISNRPTSTVQSSRSTKSSKRKRPIIYDIESDDEDDEDDEYTPMKYTGTTADQYFPPNTTEEVIILGTEAEEDFDEDIEDIFREVRRSTRSQAKPKRTRKKRQPKKLKKPKGPPLTYHERSTLKLFTHHPHLATIFPKLKELPVLNPEMAPQPLDMNVKLLPFQLEGLNWLLKQEASETAGGILADEMGMGKTIQTIALLMTDRTHKPTLVIAPTVALLQWKSEIELHTGGKLSCIAFHGANRTNNPDELMKYDVVLTTYSTLEAAFRKQKYGFKRKDGVVKEDSVLHKIHFYRVVLDEAHNIKDRNCSTSKGVCALLADKRLCLSGTPLQNRIGELYSLLRFLKLDPFDQYFCLNCDCCSNDWNFSDHNSCDSCGHRGMQHTNFFNHFMLNNIQKYGVEDAGFESFQNIRYLLKHIMLRRTKVERADDLGLPPRIVEVRKDYFNEEEKDLYRSIYSESERKFNTYVAQGVVLNNYANIFTLITRMRQVADHPDLLLKRNNSGGYLTLDDNEERTRNSLVCSLCDDEAEDAIKSKCHHIFCRLCIKEYMESFSGALNKLECPVCHIGLTIDLSQASVDPENQQISSKQNIVNRIQMSGGEWRSSTKVEALVEELYKLRSDRQTIKSIVFSQFTSMLDLVEWRLKRAGFQTVKLQGNMTPTQRDNSIRYFMENTQVEVFLVSLKAGGVALNLCEASQVFILDVWWNPSVEYQAFDRVHRIGQYRPVKIIRFCIEDSIESRIIELQQKKSDMINATVGQDDSALNRLSQSDLQFLFMN